MKRLLHIACSVMLLTLAQAKAAAPPALPKDTIKTTVVELGKTPESLEMAVDSTFSSRLGNYYDKGRTANAPHTYYSHDHYRAKLAQLHSAIPLPYNPIIRDCIDMYVHNRGRLLSRMLAKSTYYFPIIETILDKHGLPLELKYLTIVESALNPTAVSRQGATGLWQFMLSTGKLYGLTIDSLIDERRDPVRSTEAACAYLKDLYAIYGDWLLVMAAYNCGPGNVNKAMRRAGGNSDFWGIYAFLPRETRAYVPYFIAAYYSMEYYADYDVTPGKYDMPLVTDTIRVQRKHTFANLSKLTQVSVDTLKLLNPKYRRDIIPGQNAIQSVVLPAGKASLFAAVRDTIQIEPSTTEPIETTLRHKVARGETLPSIARRYGVEVADIKKWNGLRSNKLKRGRTLRIKVITEVSTPKEEVEEGSTTEVAAATSETTKPEVKKATKPKARKRIHTVRKGESLSVIASKYEGVSVKAIRRANGIKGNNIKPGQKILIP